MNSPISERPAPLVEVKARAPAHAAPITMPAAASSSSAWMIEKRFLPVFGSLRNWWQNAVNASTSEVDGVIGYHAATVAPAYTHPSAAAVLPSITIESLLPSMGARRTGRGQSKCSRAYL